jgi:hypothetical protein
VGQHLRQDPTGLSTAFSNIEVNVLGNALVQQLAERRNAKAENILDDVGFEKLGGIAGECHGALGARGCGAVARDVERDARAGRVLGPGSGNDQKFWHGAQYAELMRSW